MGAATMAEPTSTSTSLTVLAIAAVGPAAGPYAVIVMAALAGALWPLSTMEGLTKRTGAWLLLRIVATAVVLGGAGASLVERWLGVPAYDAAAAAAFVIGAVGTGWSRIGRAITGMLVRLLGRQAPR
jgi:hypothetical protein